MAWRRNDVRRPVFCKRRDTNAELEHLAANQLRVKKEPGQEREKQDDQAFGNGKPACDDPFSYRNRVERGAEQRRYPNRDFGPIIPLRSFLLAGSPGHFLPIVLIAGITCDSGHYGACRLHITSFSCLNVANQYSLDLPN
jgi:hypothetical protein